MTVDLSVYLVTDPDQVAGAAGELPDVVAAAVAGGVTAVQVRDKNASARDFLSAVTRVADVLPDRVALFVNDRVDVFLAARANGVRVTGVHIGQDDLPLPVVRTLVGPAAVIGVSAAAPGRASPRPVRPTTWGSAPCTPPAPSPTHRPRSASTGSPGWPP